MKRRFLSILLCLLLAVQLLPAGALAVGEGDASAVTLEAGGVSISGTTDAPAYAATDSEGVVTPGTESDPWNIRWDGQTLTLKTPSFTAKRPSASRSPSTANRTSPSSWRGRTRCPLLLGRMVYWEDLTAAGFGSIPTASMLPAARSPSGRRKREVPSRPQAVRWPAAIPVLLFVGTARELE